MSITQAIHRLALSRRDDVATVDGSTRRTWGEVSARTARVAGGLRQLGLTGGDRVAILALSSASYMELYYAIPWAGGVVVPINTRWSIEEIVFGLTDAGASILVADESFARHVPLLRARCPGIVAAILIPSSPDEPVSVPLPAGLDVSYEVMASSGPVAEDVVRRADDLAVICYTGGTTGASKGVMLSHGNLWSSAMCMFIEYEMTAPDTIYLQAMPLFHIGGAGAMFASVLGGATQVFLPSFDAGRALATIARERVTNALLVPTMLRMVLDQEGIDSYDLSSLRVLVYGAAPMSEAQIGEVQRRFPGVSLIQGYGATELSPLISVLGSRYHQLSPAGPNLLRSAGRPTYCTEVRICDPATGRTLASGQTGEVRVRGPNVMLGYWNRPEETRAALVDGWYCTGDAGYMDEKGFLFLVDRLKDMIITGGENVYCREVENVLAKHPAVATCVVIGVPDDKWGERVHAIVVLREGMDTSESELVDFCRRDIAGYKVPRSVELRNEPLPVSAAGKILKREIRQRYLNEARQHANLV